MNKTRDEMIAELVEHDVLMMNDNALIDMLVDGFKGYKHMTDVEVKALWDSLDK
jgi:hypothetical protein